MSSKKSHIDSGFTSLKHASEKLEISIKRIINEALDEKLPLYCHFQLYDERTEKVLVEECEQVTSKWVRQYLNKPYQTYTGHTSFQRPYKWKGLPGVVYRMQDHEISKVKSELMKLQPNAPIPEGKLRGFRENASADVFWKWSGLDSISSEPERVLFIDKADLEVLAQLNNTVYQPSPLLFVPNSDYTVIRFGDEDITPSPKQAEVIKILHKYHIERKPALKENEILDLIPERFQASTTLIDIFKKRKKIGRGWEPVPAWKLVKKVSRATYKLAI